MPSSRARIASNLSWASFKPRRCFISADGEIIQDSEKLVVCIIPGRAALSLTFFMAFLQGDTYWSCSKKSRMAYDFGVVDIVEVTVEGNRSKRWKE